MDDYRAALRRHGRARIRARASVNAASSAIADVASQAIAAGMTKVEVCKLAQVSRPALDTMLRQHEWPSP